MNQERSIAKVFRIVSLINQPTDYAHWQSKPYKARLAALEEIRREHHGWNYEAAGSRETGFFMREPGLLTNKALFWHQEGQMRVQKPGFFTPA